MNEIKQKEELLYKDKIKEEPAQANFTEQLFSFHVCVRTVHSDSVSYYVCRTQRVQ